MLVVVNWIIKLGEYHSQLENPIGDCKVPLISAETAHYQLYATSFTDTEIQGVGEGRRKK